ncbi:ABC transporter permease [Paenibacillus paeoniae]|uniref:ABC transporter permease n=1 Tax=Paenibacillus paeoniae TaxID=2292705 RepID=A0A371PKG4_9BACL|nr:ABC transporter permease [Paenibacillus paeoniae]REK76674.1 ABC transporter permease [Paenibacillus paeoniae]
MSNHASKRRGTDSSYDDLSFSIKRWLSSDGNLTRLFVIMVLVFVTMAILSPRTFLSLDSFSSMAFQFPVLGILSLAMMLSMISGGIDLSIVGIANLTSILAAMVMVRLIPEGASAGTSLLYIAVGIVCAMIVGILCGLLNGFAVAKIGIPPILVTLGSMQMFMGLAIVITKGQAIVGLPEQFSAIGNGSVVGIPMPLIIFILCIGAAYLLLNRRPFGMKLQLLGSNPTASRYGGIRNTTVLLKTYALSGLLASIAGLVMIALTNSAKADYGTSYILQAILVVVLGGVNPNGGFGKIAGVVMAVLTLQFLSSGLNALHVGNFFKDFIWGIVLILVMVINVVSPRMKWKRKPAG